MDHFQVKDGLLHAEGVPLSDVAARFGTPTYVYSRATLSRHVHVLQEALGQLPHHLCYAVKANANTAILEVLASLGCSFDAVSLGELARVLAIGVPAARTIMSGVGKRDDEIEAALLAGVLYVAVESADELAAVARIGARLGLQAPVALRVNPDVDAKTHPYIATGMAKNKFGVPMALAQDLYGEALASPHLLPCGVTCHIGSQITELEPFCDAAQRMARLTESLTAMGVPLRFVGIGGGLGIPYMDETPPSPATYGAALADILGPTGLTLVLEPGRVIVGNAGILLTRVVRKKQGAERAFVLVDAGMNDLLRPALYHACHQIVAVAPQPGPLTVADVVGPVCESADTFANAATLPPVAEGDLLAIRSAGAYGFVMSSSYNGRPRAAEVLVDGERALLVRQREQLTDLWRGEYRLDGSPATTTLPAGLPEPQGEP